MRRIKPSGSHHEGARKHTRLREGIGMPAPVGSPPRPGAPGSPALRPAAPQGPTPAVAAWHPKIMQRWISSKHRRATRDSLLTRPARTRMEMRLLQMGRPPGDETMRAMAANSSPLARNRSLVRRSMELAKSRTRSKVGMMEGIATSDCERGNNARHSTSHDERCAVSGSTACRAVLRLFVLAMATLCGHRLDSKAPAPHPCVHA